MIEELIDWIRKRCKDEIYVRNVKLAESYGLTYAPRAGIPMDQLPRKMDALDLFLKEGWKHRGLTIRRIK